MAAKEPLIVVCSNSKVYRPKPKRINKKYNIYQYKKKCTYNNKQPKQRNLRIDNNNNEFKKNMIKNNFYEEKRKNLSFNLDLISLEEIDNDFKEFKSKSEETEVQNELINLLKETNNESLNENFQTIKRPDKPFCKNIK